MSVPAAKPRRPPPISPSSSQGNRLVVSMQAQQLLRSIHVAQSTPNLSRSVSESSATFTRTSPPPPVAQRRISDSVELTKGLKPSRPPPPSLAPPKPAPRTSPKPTPRNNKLKTQITPRPTNSPSSQTDTSPTASPTTRPPMPSVRPTISSPVLKSPTNTRVSNTTTPTRPAPSHTPPTKPTPYKSPVFMPKQSPILVPKPDPFKKPVKPSQPAHPQTPPNKSAFGTTVATGGSTVAMTTKPSHSLPRSSPPSRMRSQTIPEANRSNTLASSKAPPPVTKVLVKQKRAPPRPKPPQAQPRTTHQTQPQTTPQPQPRTSQSSQPQTCADDHIYTAPSKYVSEEAGQEEYCTPLGPDDATPINEPPIYSEILDTDYVNGYSLVGEPDASHTHQDPINDNNVQDSTEGYDVPLSTAKIYTALGRNREIEGDYQSLVHQDQAEREQQVTSSDSEYCVPTTEGYMSVSLDTTEPDSIYQIPGATFDNVDTYEVPLAGPMIVTSKEQEPDYVFMSSSPIFTRKGGSKTSTAPQPERVYASVL